MRAIREASGSDQSEVITLWTACDLVKPQNDPVQDFQLALHTSNSTILLLEDSKSIVGAVVVGFDGHRGWLYYLGVRPDLQNNGYGRLLVEGAEEWLSSKGAPKVNLMVRNSNSKVIEFYKKLGYSVEEASVLGKRF